MEAHAHDVEWEMPWRCTMQSLEHRVLFNREKMEHTEDLVLTNVSRS